MNLTKKPWEFVLYTAGHSYRSQCALANINSYCEQYLPGKYSIEVIDLLAKPDLAQSDQVLGVPTLIRTSPQPTRRVIGDLSNEEKVLAVLGMPLL